jgi:hypothetical protein
MICYRCQREIQAENTQAIIRPDAYYLSWSYDLKSMGVKAWYEVVESYSGRKLTYPLDKLPALSALACDMMEEINSLYLA